MFVRQYYDDVRRMMEDAAAASTPAHNDIPPSAPADDGLDIPESLRRVPAEQAAAS